MTAQALQGGVVRRLAKVVLAAALAVALVALTATLIIKPRTQRSWIVEHAVPPQVSFDGELVQIRHLRNFQYRSATDFTPAYYDETFDLKRIDGLWFVVSPFDRVRRGPAHSLLSFGFSDGKYVAISVEARKEVGEAYSIWKGLARQYELLYVMGDEQDLIGSRVLHRDDDVYMYPIRTSEDNMRALFVEMVTKAEQLRSKPEFYNTITNNCTSSIRKHVNRFAAVKVPASWKIVLPGYSDEVLHDLGWIETQHSVQEARRRFLVNERVKRFAGHADFSKRIRDAAED